MCSPSNFTFNFIQLHFQSQRMPFPSGVTVGEACTHSLPGNLPDQCACSDSHAHSALSETLSEKCHKLYQNSFDIYILGILTAVVPEQHPPSYLEFYFKWNSVATPPIHLLSGIPCLNRVLHVHWSFAEFLEHSQHVQGQSTACCAPQCFIIFCALHPSLLFLASSKILDSPVNTVQQKTISRVLYQKWRMIQG